MAPILLLLMTESPLLCFSLKRARRHVSSVIAANSISVCRSAASEPGDGDSPADELLRAAIADSRRKSGFLPIAEEAVRAKPGDAHLLLFAAAAALLDRNPERALKFLKRFAKRFVPVNAYHLLGALALAQQNKLVLARSILESHGLDNPSCASCGKPFCRACVPSSCPRCGAAGASGSREPK